MRLDKFLKVSRIIKRRTVANDACSGGRVNLNGRTAKPGADVKAGEVVYSTVINSAILQEVIALAHSLS